MIKPLSARSAGTLVANGRRRRSKRNKARNGKSKGRTSLAKLLAGKRNPTRRKRRNGASYKKYFAKKRKRNPSVNVGNVNLVNAAIGSAVAIGLGSIGQGVIEKYATTMKDGAFKNAAPNLLVAAVAYFAHKKLKNAMAKDVAKYALIAAVFKVVDDVAGEQIKKATKNLLPKGTSGAYLPVSGVSGAWVDGTGGAYIDAGQSGMSGGLFPKASLYGL